VRRSTRIGVALLVGSSASTASFLACSSQDPAAAPVTQDGSAAVPEAAPVAQDAAPEADADAGLDPLCPPLKNDTPRPLGCTGLYSNLATKQLADGIREFTPAVPLWSDGADKTRWIYLPAGATIDVTNNSEWKFPVGTKLWKEFRVGGHRVETRFFQKLGPNLWVHASYVWAADELSATRADGVDLTTVDGNAYHVPTPSECDKCHNGRQDRVMGFEAISLGLGDAAGVTLDGLAKEGRLSPTPSVTHYTIADDGTGKAAAALGWLNVNCGVSCHNSNTTAAAYPTGLRLRLDPAQVAAGAPSQATWDSLKTTLNVGAVTPRWSQQLRISPSLPDASLIIKLISQRGTDQMPPLGTFAVDDPAVQLVRAWITNMAPQAPDAGADGG
jgi:hypothetical protein